jgi:hypothetical protein
MPTRSELDELIGILTTPVGKTLLARAFVHAMWADTMPDIDVELAWTASGATLRAEAFARVEHLLESLKAEQPIRSAGRGKA